MMEHAVLFGSSKSLVGVISESTAGDKPNVILLNAGLLHRIGPNRTYVTLLRRLCEQGYTGLRFDLSGIGDSPAATDGLPESESRIRDIREAMDMMAQRTGESRFVLGGLCNGAVSTFATAIEDPRVVGMILLDAFPYRTLGHYLRHYRNRLFRAQSWVNLVALKHPLTAWLRRTRDPEPSRDTSIFPPPPVVDAAYRKLLDRGVQSLEVYFGEIPFNDRRQLAEMFPSIADDPNVTLEHLRHINHLIVLQKHQEEVIGCIERWMASVDWPAPG